MDPRVLQAFAIVAVLAGTGIVFARTGRYRIERLVAGLALAMAPAYYVAATVGYSLLMQGAPFSPLEGVTRQLLPSAIVAAGAALMHVAISRMRWWTPFILVVAVGIFESLAPAARRLGPSAVPVMALGLLLPVAVALIVATPPREAPARVPRSARALLVIPVALVLVSTPGIALVVSWGQSVPATTYEWRVTVTPEADHTGTYHLYVPFPTASPSQNPRITADHAASILDALRERATADSATLSFPSSGVARLESAGSAVAEATYAFHGNWAYRHALQALDVPVHEIRVEGPNDLVLHVAWEFRVGGINCIPARYSIGVVVSPDSPAFLLPEGQGAEQGVLGRQLCTAHGD